MSNSHHDPQVRKQVSVFLPASDWRALRDEAARQRLSLAELCRRWLAPGLQELRRHPDRPLAARHGQWRPDGWPVARPDRAE